MGLYYFNILLDEISMAEVFCHCILFLDNAIKSHTSELDHKAFTFPTHSVTSLFLDDFERSH